ncbi:MAG: hypothetical protein J4O09_14030, partial [Chloroflexi bacterium]|nr:hypothetical protein [Chloroflexota bacterium]
ESGTDAYCDSFADGNAQAKPHTYGGTDDRTHGGADCNACADAYNGANPDTSAYADAGSHSNSHTTIWLSVVHQWHSTTAPSTADHRPRWIFGI